MRRRHQAHGQRLVAHDVAVNTGLHLRLVDDIGGPDRLDGFAVTEARLQRPQVRLYYFRPLLELGFDEFLSGVQRAAIEPVQDSQGKHVGGTRHQFIRQIQILDGSGNEPGHIGLHQLVIAYNFLVFQGIGFPARQIQVPPVKIGRIGNDQPVFAQIRQVHFQGGGIHRHENIRLVTGGLDVLTRKLQLERTDPGQRSCGGTYFRGVVRQCGQVIAHNGSGLCKLAAGELHSISGVASKTDCDPLQRLDTFFGTLFGLTHLLIQTYTSAN